MSAAGILSHSMLSPEFLSSYLDTPTTFGFSSLGKFIFDTKYSRQKEDGEKETWKDTVVRVVNGTFRMLNEHMRKTDVDFEWSKDDATDMFDRIYKMKFLPPGRGLWIMGSPANHLGAALNNCAFVSTKSIEDARPFAFLMDMSMLGVGVGFDTEGAGSVFLHSIIYTDLEYNVEDTRMGWVKATTLVIMAGFGSPAYKIRYDDVRVAGTPLKTFGGIASGPKPLIDLHNNLVSLFNSRAGALITATDIVDIMNLIGQCVVAGNIRRTAEIALGPPTSEFMDLKNYSINPSRRDYGWTSNNSVIMPIGSKYDHVAERIKQNGEPGVLWLENAIRYSRIPLGEDWKDSRARGTNPCGEQTLENFELCCLVETFPNHHSSEEDFQATLRSAFLYAKAVTLAKTHVAETNAVIERNRRIGCSISGVAQFIGSRGLHELRSYLLNGFKMLTEYDCKLSTYMGINKSIKITSVKPSGTVSLLAGATPGMHFPEARTYIRRVRLSKLSNIEEYKKAGYEVEDDVYDTSSAVISFPINVGNVRIASEVSMWEQLMLASMLQEVWADNSVSCTITFSPEEGKDIVHALEYFQYKLKSVSFLPRLERGAYPQMPYEAIDLKRYEEMVSKLKPLTVKHDDALPEDFCGNDQCIV